MSFSSIIIVSDNSENSQEIDIENWIANDYELERLQRIAKNRKMLYELGLGKKTLVQVLLKLTKKKKNDFPFF